MRTLLLPILALLALLPGPAAGADAPPDSPASHAVVLMYHRFGETRYPTTDVRLDQLDAQLAHLADGGFKIWPLARIVADLAAGRPIPDRVVAITVDDAYRSVYTEAFPRLRARGWPFTVFVATDAVDRGFPALLTWDQMREMAKSGAAFANHTATHAHLLKRGPGEGDAAWAARVRADIGKAQARLKAELGTAPMLFAYPYGEYDLKLARIVRGMGFTPFGQESGAVGPHSDPDALPRFPVSEAYGTPEQFRVKVASLPLPVARVKPRDPVVSGADPPRMRLDLDRAALDDLDLDALACYTGPGVRAGVVWRDRDAGRLTVTAPGPLPVGRSRYNCTAPSRRLPGRYYWYSHLWFRPGR